MSLGNKTLGNQSINASKSLPVEGEIQQNKPLTVMPVVASELELELEEATVTTVAADDHDRPLSDDDYDMEGFYRSEHFTSSMFN